MIKNCINCKHDTPRANCGTNAKNNEIFYKANHADLKMQLNCPNWRLYDIVERVNEIEAQDKERLTAMKILETRTGLPEMNDVQKFLFVECMDTWAGHVSGKYRKYSANEVDGAYLLGVFNSGGIDKLSDELKRLKELDVKPHQILNLMKS